MALKVDYIGSTYTIKVKTGVTSLDVRSDLYSPAKDEWQQGLSNVLQYSFPWLVINDIGGGQNAPSYFFLKSPWTLETSGDGNNHEISINLYAIDENGNPRDPFRVLSGDAVTSKTSDIPGSDLIAIINDNVDSILTIVQGLSGGSGIKIITG